MTGDETQRNHLCDFQNCVTLAKSSKVDLKGFDVRLGILNSGYTLAL